MRKTSKSQRRNDSDDDHSSDEESAATRREEYIGWSADPQPVEFATHKRRWGAVVKQSVDVRTENKALKVANARLEAAATTLVACLSAARAPEKIDPCEWVRHLRTPSKPGDFPHGSRTFSRSAPGGGKEQYQSAYVIARKKIMLSGTFQMTDAASAPEVLRGALPSAADFVNQADAARREVNAAYSEKRARESAAATNDSELPSTAMPSSLLDIASDARHGLRVSSVNASVFGNGGIVFRIIIIDTSTGIAHGPNNLPKDATKFLEWTDGSTMRDTFYVPSSATTWSISFFFPHLSRRGSSSSWIIRIEPFEQETRDAWPNLSLSLDPFQCVSRQLPG